jgi:NAD(P)H dehydrogenase (quinone)
MSLGFTQLRSIGDNLQVAHPALQLRERFLRTIDAGDSQHFPCQKLHQQSDARDTRPFRHDEHIERRRRRRMVWQDRFEAAVREKIVHQPDMGWADAASGKIGFAGCQPVIDAQAATERHDLGFAIRTSQHEDVASSDVRHADAFKARQVLVRRRSSMPREVTRRADEDAPAVPKRPQLHGTVGERAEADGDVHAIAHEVDAFVGQAEIDGDLGMAVLKGEDQPADISNSERCSAGYANRARRRPACTPCFVASLFQQTQNLDSIGVVAAAFLGQRNAPRRSAKQNHAQCLLQFVKMPRDAGLTNIHLARDSRKVSALRDANERPHAFECDVRLIHFTALSYPYPAYTGLMVRRLVCKKTVSSKRVLAMNVLIVFAHPEPRSLNAALRDVAVEELQAQDHTVQVSDLYAMNWKSQVDRADFPDLDADARLKAAAASDAAFKALTLTEDVKAEQEKLLWADVLILQFPLWWFTMPAILKGWVDRVYTSGFAHGVGEHSETHWGDRYGEGRLAGKRAMLMVTTGGWESHYAPRGINGAIDDILFPINHGILHYPGYDVLPPFVSYKSDRLDAAGFELAAGLLRARLRTLKTTPPIPFRRQNDGDYLIPSLELRPELGAVDATGFSLHLKQSE